MNGTNARYLTFPEQVHYAQKVKDGDEHAFGVLYDHFSQAITGYVAGKLSNVDDAKDLVADCFTKALSAMRDGKFDTRYSVYTFLRAIADNTIRRYLKQRYVRTPGHRGDAAPEYKPKLLYLVDREHSAGKLWKAASQELQAMPAQDVEAIAWELFRIVLSSCLKPHHGVVFGFIRLLEWRPREIVKQLSDNSLHELTKRLYHDFASLFPSHRIPQTMAQDHCPKFFDSLERAAAEVFAEPEYENLRVPPRKTGQLLLREFYGQNPSASLSDWCDKVRNRARNAMRVGI